jgi:hypothetical protein
MIKLSGTNAGTGGRVLALGLSEWNLVKLREGRPIHIAATELPEIEVDIVIFWGETEDKLAEMVQPLIDRATRITDRRQERKQ